VPEALGDRTDVPLLFLSASSTDAIIQSNLELFNVPRERVWIVKRPVDRPNLALSVVAKQGDGKEQLLVAIRALPPEAAGMVFVHRRFFAEEVALFLCKNGVAATYYHGGLTHEARRARADEWAIGGSARVMVGTSAISMGIDREGVAFIFHLVLSQSPDGYVQEIGRGGRQGEQTICRTFYSEDDYITLREQITSNRDGKMCAS
jgi:ATP-dependent DNA helicase RecQ